MTAQRKLDHTEPDEGADSHELGPMPTLLYAADQLVSVTLTHHPVRSADSGACRCPACQAVTPVGAAD
jgi:hypothetical protein